MFELAEHVAQLLGLPKDQVRAHEVSKPENLKVRAIPRAGDNVAVAVVTGGDLDRTESEAGDLVGDGRFRTIALVARAAHGEWEVVKVVSSDPATAKKLSDHWPDATARLLHAVGGVAGA